MVAGISECLRVEDVSAARVAYSDGLEDAAVVYALVEPLLVVGAGTRIGGM